MKAFQTRLQVSDLEDRTAMSVSQPNVGFAMDFSKSAVRSVPVAAVVATTPAHFTVSSAKPIVTSAPLDFAPIKVQTPVAVAVNSPFTPPQNPNKNPATNPFFSTQEAKKPLTSFEQGIVKQTQKPGATTIGDVNGLGFVTGPTVKEEVYKPGSATTKQPIGLSHWSGVPTMHGIAFGTTTSSIPRSTSTPTQYAVAASKPTASIPTSTSKPTTYAVASHSTINHGAIMLEATGRSPSVDAARAMAQGYKLTSQL